MGTTTLAKVQCVHTESVLMKPLCHMALEKIIGHSVDKKDCGPACGCWLVAGSVAHKCGEYIAFATFADGIST
ncbi:hypothetical protein BHF74_10480 [Corynebacterium diphtheriae]|nr:hypothetical protein BHF74_10480 [Corynebacterium diphtheriae]